MFEDNDLQDVMVECLRSTKVMAKAFFPERFSSEFSHYLHDPIFELIDSPARKIAIAAPRGSGKTSICIAKAAQSALFQMSKFVCWVSTSHDVATMQTENLKRELVTSPEIKKIFGPVKARSADELDESFSKKAWVCKNTLILPRGCGQQVRGVLFGSSRPDLFIVDDLEHPEEIKNEDIRRARKQWFYADLEKAVSRFSKDWKIIYIDTLKHEDSLLQDLLDSKDWESVRLEICNDKLEPMAPEIMDAAEVKAEYDRHKEIGQLDVFYREYRNLPTSSEDAVFKQGYFRYKTEEELAEINAHIENVIIIDPAKTAKMTSADSAIVGVGIDTKSNALYVRDIIAAKLHPDEIYAESINMARRLKARVIAVEVTSLNEFITQPFKNELSRQNFLCDFIELKARGGRTAESKEQRIKALSPYYRQGLIFHNPNCCHGLEAQLLSYPRSKRWDIMDALAYVVELLDIGNRYFEPVYDENEDDYDLDKDEDFIDLMKQNDPVEDNWRIF